MNDVVGDQPQGEDAVAEQESPDMMLGQTVIWGGQQMVVIVTDHADSNLPRRDGQPGRAKLGNVYELVVEPLLENQENTGPEAGNEQLTVFCCRFCHNLYGTSQTVVAHQRNCAKRPVAEVEATVDEAPHARRIYVTRAVREMTLGEILDLARSNQALETQVIGLAESLSDERRRRRAAEKDLDAIRKALGLPVAKDQM